MIAYACNAEDDPTPQHAALMRRVREVIEKAEELQKNAPEEEMLDLEQVAFRRWLKNYIPHEFTEFFVNRWKASSDYTDFLATLNNPTEAQP